MHNGTLKEHLHGKSHAGLLIMFQKQNNLFINITGVLTQERHISWIKRLEIAEDAAKGLNIIIIKNLI